MADKTIFLLIGKVVIMIVLTPERNILVLEKLYIRELVDPILKGTRNL